MKTYLLDIGCQDWLRAEKGPNSVTQVPFVDYFKALELQICNAEPCGFEAPCSPSICGVQKFAVPFLLWVVARKRELDSLGSSSYDRRSLTLTSHDETARLAREAGHFSTLWREPRPACATQHSSQYGQQSMISNLKHARRLIWNHRAQACMAYVFFFAC